MLPTDWLARTLDTVDDEARRWPQSLKDSYRELTGHTIGPDPRDERITELEAALREIAEVAETGFEDARSSCRTEAKAIAHAARQVLK